MFHCFNDLNRFSVWCSEKKIKFLGNSDDIADQITVQNNGQSLRIPRANLELKHCHVFIIHWDSLEYSWNIAEWNRPWNFCYKTNISLFVFSEHYDLSFNPADKYLDKVENRNTILICWLWPKSTIQALEQFHAVFIVNFEHIQLINLIFSLLTLNMYLPVGYWIKSTK